jgi:outer membrane lipopolysaccharide assembly protein LptE/RlpB
LILLLTGCGYGLLSDPEHLPHDIKTLHVALFENRTTEPYLENVVTENVVRRLLRIPELRLQSSSAEYDAVLSGKINSYYIKASAYDALDQPQQYRLNMKIEAQLQRSRDGRILWRGELLRSAEFLANADLMLQADFERQAQQQVAERLAEDLSYQIASDF